MGSNQKWYRVHYWPEVTGRGPVRKSPDCFPQFCSRTLFSRICFPVLFPRIVFRISPYFFPVFFPRIFVPYFFYIFFQYLFSLCEYGCCCCYCCCHISQSSSSSHAYRGNISTENRYKKNTGKQFTGKNYGKNTKKNTKKKGPEEKYGGKKYGKKERGKGHVTSGQGLFGHFWSSMRTVSLPVAPHCSPSNTNLSVPIYYCSWRNNLNQVVDAGIRKGVYNLIEIISNEPNR